MRSISIAFSPCPNDTYLFGPWAFEKKIGSHLLDSVHLADIDELNRLSLEMRYPLMKVSVAQFAHVVENYFLLPVGAAIGYKGGPIVVAKKPFTIEEITKKRLAIPGKHTSAYLLFRTLFPEPETVISCTYTDVLKAIDEGTADAGIIIHETRFLFEKRGFHAVCDLGECFHKKYNCPVPLGVLIGSKKISSLLLQQCVQTMRESLLISKKRVLLADYIISNSQEKDPKIIQKHIDTFVTEETMQLSSLGIESITQLFKEGVDKGILPKKALSFSIFEAS